MSDRAAVHSIDALREFRVALGLFSEDALAALGAVDMEVRRTLLWLQQDRRLYWQDQIKKRTEQVAMAKAEVFRRQLAKTADYTPAYSEQKELLRKAEESLRDAERRAALVKKWEQVLPQVILEYRATTRRIKDMASGDVVRAGILLERMVQALEAYLRELPPSGAGEQAPLVSIANTILDEDKTTPPEDAVASEPAGAAPEAGEAPVSTDPTPRAHDPAEPPA